MLCSVFYKYSLLFNNMIEFKETLHFKITCRNNCFHGKMGVGGRGNFRLKDFFL